MKTSGFLVPLSLLVLSGCWDFVRYDNQSSVDGGASSDAITADYRTLKLVMTSMAPHPGHFFEYRIVSPSNVILSRGFVDPLGANDVTITAVRAIPSTGGPYRVDFWADQNQNHVLDLPPQDHSWRRLLQAPAATVAGDTVTVNFVHDFNFDDIQSDLNGNPKVPVEGPAPVIINFTNTASLAGKLLTLRVFNDRQHQVGSYRYQAFPDTAKTGGTLTVRIPGITEEGVLNTVEIFSDASGNRAFDPASRGGADKTWKFSGTATAAGFNTTFNPTDDSGTAEITDPGL